jgi:translation elongation factor EF-G
MRKHSALPSQNGKFPADLADKAKEYREKLIENGRRNGRCRDGSVPEGKEPDIATLKKCIRKGTIAFKLIPMMCGSAFKNKGVQPLLDAVVDLPAGSAGCVMSKAKKLTPMKMIAANHQTMRHSPVWPSKS